MVMLLGFHVVGHGPVVFQSEKVRTQFVRVLLVVFFSGFIGVGEVNSRDPAVFLISGFVSVGEVNSRDPAVFLISAFITCPTNKVKEFAGFPISVIVFGVRYFTEFIFYVIINHNGFRWWWSSIIELVWDAGLELRDMENRMYPAEIVGKGNSNRVLANMVEDLEGTKVSFRKSLGGTGGANEIGKDENFIARVEQQRSPVEVGSCLVALLSELEGVC